MKKSISGLLTVLILFLFLTHPVLTRDGAARGLLLWSRTVLPTLLPFMLCSQAIVAFGGLPLLTAPFRPLFRSLFHLSDAGGYVLISGLLCGYPMGAKTCREFLDQGRISFPEARCLLAVSNHPSPMFVLGYLASLLDPCVSVPRILAALYLPVLPLFAAARRVYGFPPPQERGYAGPSCSDRSGQVLLSGTRPRAAGQTPPGETACANARSYKKLPQAELCQSRPDADGGFDEILMRSIETMVRIGGYIMLFSILAAYIEQFPGLPAVCRALALGAAEITTGLGAVCRTVSGETQGLLCTAVTAFGGLSGIFQTKSVLRPLSAVPPVRRASIPLDAPSPIRPAAFSPYEKESPGILPGTLRSSRSPAAQQTHENAGLSLRHYVLWKLAHTVIACLLYSLPHILRFPVR